MSKRALLGRDVGINYVLIKLLIVFKQLAGEFAELKEYGVSLVSEIVLIL